MGEIKEVNGILPRIGPGSQMHVLKQEAARIGVKHGQTVTVVAQDVNVAKVDVAYLKPSQRAVAPYEVRFCNAQFRLDEVNGEGDDLPLPEGERATIRGVPVPEPGLYTMVLELYSNGSWDIKVKSAYRQDKLVTA